MDYHQGYLHEAKPPVITRNNSTEVANATAFRPAQFTIDFYEIFRKLPHNPLLILGAGFG